MVNGPGIRNMPLIATKEIHYKTTSWLPPIATNCNIKKPVKDSSNGRNSCGQNLDNTKVQSQHLYLNSDSSTYLTGDLEWVV